MELSIRATSPFQRIFLIMSCVIYISYYCVDVEGASGKRKMRRRVT